MMIRAVQSGDHEELVQLIAKFRVTLTGFHGRTVAPDIESAEVEMSGYDRPNYRVYVAESEEKILVGFLVCRIEKDYICAEALFVLPEYRRQKIGWALYDKVERLAEQNELDTVYNSVHPNNDRMIAFLNRRGFRVLNMIELRKARPGEPYMERIKVGKNTFDYCC
jgi:ribosomal protein S18 acetylase RimI-like enzyme